MKPSTRTATILITSGPTREPLDPVRFLSNASSGRMGAALTAEALARGHQVDLVSGPVAHEPPSGARLVRVETTLEMLEACKRLHRQADVVIGAAAVCDFRPSERLEAKRPRGAEQWTIDLIPNPDILAELGRDKGARTHVGFALETAPTDEALSRARDKLRRKRLDWIVLNPASAIGATTSEFYLVPASGPEIALGIVDKRELARHLFDVLGI